MLGSGIMMLILDMHRNPSHSLDAFLRSLVIICVSVGLFVIMNETLSHVGLFDEQAEPSLLAMSRSMV
jgi:hypothetical protein